ncbi:MAG: hypothetical protein JO307_23505 [Bryobacterales bacterium]|nr:hypothetical protein [Bryobacterales bacterium]MBV9398397.1 hypothetical protein [Bryobacterales bacterium]
MFLLTQSTHRMLIRHDPDVGHVFVPNLRARIPGEDGGYLIVTNSWGFRSNFEYEKEKGPRPRILMFGDSYTAADNVSNEDRYSDKLAHLLDVEVQNYGVPGSGTDQHLLMHRKLAKDVAADLVMICVQIDSFHRIQVSHRPAVDRITGRHLLVPKPYFELQNGSLILRQVPVPTERPIDDGASSNTGSKKENEWYREIVNVYKKVPGLSTLRHAPAFEDLGSRLISELHRFKKIQPYPDITSPHTPGWKLMEAILKQFIAEAKPRSVMIVPIPTLEFYMHGVEPIYQDLFARLDDPSNGVHVADVSTMLVKLPWKTRQRLRYEQGGHFTPFANQLVADKMAEFIRKRELLKNAGRDSSKPAPRPSAALGPRNHTGTYILGVSCFYHNSAAALIRDGEIVAAAEEERFTRVKNDRRFPHQAINYCLEEAGIHQNQLAAIVYYDNTGLTVERIFHSIMAVDRHTAEKMWMKILPSWLRLKLHFPELIRKHLNYSGPVLQGIHHRSHAASCFFPSPFDRAAILTIDGVGEWATAAIGCGKDNEVRLLRELHFPHSLGLLYSAFTQFTGFKVNSGEYKMMGLAPYGRPLYVGQILDNLVNLKDDGSLDLNLSYFGFLHDTQMTNEGFAKLFGGPRREPESRITRREMDLARSIQVVTEECILRMAKTARDLTGEDRLCLAGGVALNCVANGRLLREGPFKELWIQPAAGDSGCALGAALDVYYSYFGGKRNLREDGRPRQGGSYLGPEFNEDEIRSFLDTFGYPHRYLPENERSQFLAGRLEEGKVVGHFAGRLEYGPRSLGARSILGDPRNPAMQAELNLRIKYRESFRPFAPAVMAECASAYFEIDCESPYMLLVAPVKKERRLPIDPDLIPVDDDLLPVVRQLRSDVPAITHVDYSARIQTVRRVDHPVFYDLIDAFRKKTGCAVVVNTSFNVRGEPIVCTPQDAYRCFMRTEMDVLALGNFVLLKSEQPAWPEAKGEGLENEDVSVSSPEEHPEELLNDLRRIFTAEFWPAALRLKENEQVLVHPAYQPQPSAWTPSSEPQDLRTLFECPDPPQNGASSASNFADLLTKPWLSRAAAESLRTALAKSIEAGLKHPIKSDLGESVSESVYVMF